MTAQARYRWWPDKLRRPGVLEENVINIEGVKVAGPVPIHGLRDADDKLLQLSLVVVRNPQTRRLLNRPGESGDSVC